MTDLQIALCAIGGLIVVFFLGWLAQWTIVKSVALREVRKLGAMQCKQCGYVGQLAVRMERTRWSWTLTAGWFPSKDASMVCASCGSHAVFSAPKKEA